MPVEITVNDPEYYLERLSTGCILDPSVFYSGQYVEATIEVISTAKPGKVYLSSNLFKAIKGGSWSSFLTTLTLWSGNYEQIPDAWRQCEFLVSEFEPLPIEIPEQDKKIQPIFNALAEDGKLSPLYRLVFELTACSYLNSIPVFVGSHSRFRLLELLNHKLQTIIIEPVGQWARRKKQYLSGRKLRIPLFALKLMGGAFVFIESIQMGNVMSMGAGGSVVVATIIDGSV
jgi:hypothetical protein